MLLQVMCQLISSGIQIPVGQVLVLEAHGYRLRSTLHLGLKHLMDTLIRRIRGVGGIPLHQQLLPLPLS